MRKIFIVAAALTALAIPTAGLAAAPDGQWNFKDNGASANASSIGQQSSAIKQNGQFIKGVDGVMDQTTYPGSRADLVQVALGH